MRRGGRSVGLRSFRKSKMRPRCGAVRIAADSEAGIGARRRGAQKPGRTNRRPRCQKGVHAPSTGRIWTRNLCLTAQIHHDAHFDRRSAPASPNADRRFPLDFGALLHGRRNESFSRSGNLSWNDAAMGPLADGAERGFGPVRNCRGRWPLVSQPSKTCRLGLDRPSGRRLSRQPARGVAGLHAGIVVLAHRFVASVALTRSFYCLGGVGCFRQALHEPCRVPSRFKYLSYKLISDTQRPRPPAGIAKACSRLQRGAR
jgi:hypothetical protein